MQSLVCAGGIPDMAKSMDDHTVQFGLLKLDIGSGSFKRSKMVFVHLQGENAGAVAKGRLNTLKGSVKTAVGATHAEVQLYSVDDCSTENVLEQLGSVMSMDDMGGFSIAKMTEDYEAMIASSGPAPSGGGDVLARAATRQTAAEMGTVEAAKALEAVKQPLGPFNWALFKPSSTLDLHNAGSMSVNEMSKWLAADQVLFGLLRMGFGVGKFRRVKWICLHWSGESVSPVKRGRANALKKDILKWLEPFSLTVSASDADEMTLETIIDKVKRTAVVDGGTADADEDPFSMESFMKALREEAAANAEFFGEDDADEDAGDLPFKSTVDAVAGTGGFNWMLIGKA
jgi:hypothetical protein